MAPSQPGGGGGRPSAAGRHGGPDTADHKATAISLLVALGVRRDDGQKLLLAVQHMARESTAVWRQFLENPDARGLPQPALVSIDGGPGLEAAVTALRGEDLPIQRCTVHQHRNLPAHAPKRLHEEWNGGRGR